MADTNSGLNLKAHEDFPEEVKKKYLEQGGNNCPNCGSVSFKGGFVQIDGDSAWQAVSCNDCDTSWEDQYTLTNVVREGC